MKKLLFFIILSLSFGPLLSQLIYNRSYHQKNERSNPFVVLINGDVYFTTQIYEQVNFGSCYLYKHNSNGVLQFRIPIAGTNRQAIKTLDNKLLIAGGSVFCDFLGLTQSINLQKIDNAGAIVFTTTNTVKGGDNTKALVQHSDSSFFSFTDSLMFKHSKTGAFVSKTNPGLTSISSAIVLQNNNILISAKHVGATSLVEITPTGSTVSVKPFPLLLNKMEFYGSNKIMGLGSDGSYYKISNNHYLIAASNLPGIGIVDFTILRDTIYNIYSSTGILSRYSAADTSFVAFNLSTTSTDRIYQVAIAVDNKSVAVLSNGISKLSYSFPEHYFASLSAFTKTGSNNFSNDITLVSLEADSLYSNCVPVQLPPGNRCFSYLRAKVKIKNKSSQTLNDFKLNSFDMPGVACGGWFYQEKFSNLNLQPGDSITLTATSFAEKDLGYFPSTNTLISMNYCFYTTLPNGETDKIFADNELCKNFTTLPSSVPDLNSDPTEMVIYPNPAENYLTIACKIAIKKLELYNALGALVKTENTNSAHIQVSMQELPRGIYFLKLETEKGSQTKKILKE